MACCLEVVLFSYSSQRTFPWIINVFKLAPFYFYKVIEVFIRSEEGLSRDMVKHLNSIEEQVLESRAWTSDSALWSALQAAENRVPTVEEVNFSSNLDSGSGLTSGGPSYLPLLTLSPIIHPRIREFRSGLDSARKDVPPSPLSVHDRYSSPAAGSLVKRRLFGDDPPAPKTGLNPGMSPASSPAKRLTFGSSSTLRIGEQETQTTIPVLSIPLQGRAQEHSLYID
uniref:retinoblastoma-like protein 1 n=1 Tax=Monopterus albus TaxID=43700 RepID=UPI0009B3C058|nr:retinoblastoma-like protein 1 [Monopterus albus]